MKKISSWRGPDRGPNRLTQRFELWALCGVLTFFALTLVSALAWAQPESAQGAGAAAAQGVTAKTWVFRAIAFFTLLGAASMIVVRNPLVAALCLVGTLFGVGGMFLMMRATFLAAMQILVYAGAVMVLFMFVIMSVGRVEKEEVGFWRGTLSKVVGIAAAAILIWILAPLLKTIGGPATDPKLIGDVRTVGRLLFSEYLLPFEALSLLLLVAIVGAVMVSRRAIKPTPKQAEEKGGGA